MCKEFGSKRYLFEHRLEDYPYSLWDLNEHAIFIKFERISPASYCTITLSRVLTSKMEG